MMEEKNYYKLLGVDRKSTQAEIKKAFYKKIKTAHPDKNNSDSISSDKVIIIRV